MAGGRRGQPTGPHDGVSGRFRLSRTVAFSTSIERKTRSGKAADHEACREGDRHSRLLGVIVRTVKGASKDEVTAAFLRAQNDSERHSRPPERPSRELISA